MWKKTAILLAALLLTIVFSGTQTKALAVSASDFNCYLQTDDRWADVTYGYRDSAKTQVAYIGRIDLGSGCALLSMTNAVNALQKGVFLQPEELAEWSLANNLRVNGVGTSHSFVKKYLDAFGSQIGVKYDANYPTNFLASQDAVKNHLNNGGVAIINVVGHFACLVAYDSATDRYLALDSAPSSNRRSLPDGKVWLTPSELENDSKYNRWTVKNIHLLSRTGAVIPEPPVSLTPPVTCSCNPTVGGMYRCTTASKPLNIRDGHSTEATKVGEIPSGAMVHVTAASSDWAHVSYNGVSGYASMQYLERIGTGIAVNGTRIGYENGSVFSTGENFITANRRFADFCQNAVYGVNYTQNPGCFGLLYDPSSLLAGWTVVLKDGLIFTIASNSGQYIELLSLEQDGNNNKVKLWRLNYQDAVNVFLEWGVERIELWNHTGLNGGGGSTESMDNTAMTPEIIVHIDRPAGKYDGSDHIEISGWIASRQALTYVMGECEAFGQINLTDSLTDASAELDGAGYSAYPYKYRYSSVIDRKYLQPNTTYTMKVWAGMANGGTSGVCGQSFDVTSIEPTLIRFTQPSGSTLTGGKDVTVAGTILALNPITDAKGKLADINGSTQELDFDLKLTANNTLASGTKYTYGYNFTGTLPMALVKASNTTATIFVTAIDQNQIKKTEPKTCTIGTVVYGDINSYEFVYDQEYVRVTGSGSQTLSGVVHANAPIADVMCILRQWAAGSGNTMMASVTEATPKSGYKYAKKFSLTVSAGDLCDVLGVDSFTDNEFRVRFWCDLVSNSGAGVHKESSVERTVFGNNVSNVSYTVKYNANGGSGAPSSQSMKHNKSLTVSTTVPTRTGYTFMGWATSSTSGEVKYAPGGTYKTNANVTLYAVWEKAKDIPTNLLSYDLTASITIKNAPKVYKLVPSAATKYRFTASGSAGANVTIQNASGTAVATFSGASSAAKELMLSDNQTYYIVVKPGTANATGSVNLNILRSYAITFDANGGAGAPSETLYQFSGESVTLPETVPTGTPLIMTYDFGDGRTTEYTINAIFNAWTNNDYKTIERWYPEEEAAFSRSLTLFADWGYPSLGAAGTYETPERDGLVFMGWEDKNGYPVDWYTVPVESETFIAVWTDAIPLEGIKITPRSMELEVGDKAQLMVSAIPSGAMLPEVTFESSNPVSVTVSASGEVEVLAPGVSTITASTTDGLFSAQAVITVGEPIFTLTYDLNGGSGNAPPAETVYYGDPYFAPNAIPERTGYRFLGWSEAPDAEMPQFFPGESAVIERSMTLYAVWEKATYPVVYDACGGENAPEAQIKVYGETLTLSSTAPTRSDYAFAGWALQPMASAADYHPGDAYTANAPLTLYALWRAHATGVTLNYPVLVLTEGGEKTLKATLQPAEAAGGTLLWTSSNEAIATVAGGKVTGHSVGSAVITCAVAENPALTAACRVTVTPAQADGDAPEAPQMQCRTVRQGDVVQLLIEMNTVNAAYAKLIYSYDASALTLTDVMIGDSHVTPGPNALVLAVPYGAIPEGLQAALTFDVKPDAAPGLYPLDVAVVEAFTHGEVPTQLYAVAADSVQINCAQHTPEMIPPMPATRTESGLGAGSVCSACQTVLKEQEVISPDRCLWLPQNLKALEAEALAGLNMQQAVLPEGIETIGSRAFANCKDLLIVVLPESAGVAANAFEGCNSPVLLAPDGTILESTTP